MKATKKIVITTNTRLVLLIAAIILLAGSGYGLVKALTPSIVNEKTVLYSYTISAGGNYEVILIANELYPEGVLGEDRLYARNLIDRLNITFTAEYTGNQAASVSGDYTIDVTIQGYQMSGDSRKIVYEHNNRLAENKSIQGETSVNIYDTVSLDLNLYKDFADRAEQILNAKPSREAKVTFRGNFQAQSDYGEVEEPFSYSLQLPLTNELFSITKETPLSLSNEITEMRATTIKPAVSHIILAILGLLLGLIAMVVLASGVRAPTMEEEYVRNFRALQRKYGSRMAQLSRLPFMPPDSLVEVGDWDSLVKISDERQQSICYCLNEEGLPVEGLLYVPDDQRHYVLYWGLYSFGGSNIDE